MRWQIHALKRSVGCNFAAKDPASIVREASIFFDEADSAVYGQVSMEVFEHLGKQGFFSRRRGCCLAWRTGRASATVPIAFCCPRINRTSSSETC